MIFGTGISAIFSIEISASVLHEAMANSIDKMKSVFFKRERIYGVTTKRKSTI